MTVWALTPRQRAWLRLLARVQVTGEAALQDRALRMGFPSHRDVFDVVDYDGTILEHTKELLRLGLIWKDDTDPFAFQLTSLGKLALHRGHFPVPETPPIVSDPHSKAASTCQTQKSSTSSGRSYPLLERLMKNWWKS